MKIALIGYGKMGQAIEKIALQRNHSIVLKVDLDNAADLNPAKLSQADMAIEFTGPQTAFTNILKCLEAGVPTVCGSTGWLEKQPEAEKFCLSHNGSLLYSSNFSVGVNIFFEINKKLAELMGGHPEYKIGVTEVHHMGKKDAPSGTAISLAQQIIANVERKKRWVNYSSENIQELEIISQRRDNVPGIHAVKYSSPIDDMEIIHTAHNREGFATGAVLAAEFLQHRKGIFTMKDVLSL
jgi:4-hydroxy-tetrahydrodipicolinate reductase